MTPSDVPVPRRLSRDEFASLVAHELRNPLHAMSGWLHLLTADPGLQAVTTQRAFGGLKRALEQQFEQIDLLARVIRLEAGGTTAARERVDLGELVAAVAEALRPAAEAAGRAVEIACAAGVPIRADREPLQAALTALGGFALRHGVPGAPLRLTLDDAARLRVAIDEGEDGSRSIWHAFGESGARLPLDLLHARLAIEAQGARIGPSGEGRPGDWLEIDFEPSPATAPGAHRAVGRSA